MKKRIFLFIWIMAFLFTACAKGKETSVKIQKESEVLTAEDGTEHKQEQKLDSWIGYYERKADSLDDGHISMKLFVYQEDGQYYGYLNMEGFEHDGDWAYSYPRARMLTELREEQGTVYAYYVEDFSESKQEEYFGSYQAGDILFSMQMEENGICTEWEKFAIREQKESREQEFVPTENCIDITLLNQRDKEIFLKAKGISENEQPFYRYEQDTLFLEVYYDEQKEKGFGLYYEQMRDEAYVIGFDITECVEKEWKDNRFVFTKEGEEIPQLEDYKEEHEYNEKGQLIKYESKGMIEDYKEELQEDTVIRMELSYREDGTLEQKKCYYNQWIFGTTRGSETYYYDEKERLIYTSAYITHGYLEDYYIYDGDCMEPSYCLTVDHCGRDAWALELVRYEPSKCLWGI